MALTDDVALYALSYWAHERHPLRIEDCCLNARQSSIPCAECNAVCPRGIEVNGRYPRWLMCSNCNLCVTACPAQAIHGSSGSFDALLSLMKAETPSVVVACNKYAGDADLKLDCLASVPWEMLAALSLKKQLVVKSSPCKDCDNEDGLRLFRSNIDQVKRFFGKDEFKRRILSKLPEGETRIDGSAKRRAIRSAVGKVRKGVEQLTTEDAGELSHYRAVLLNALENMPEGKRPAVHWQALIEDGRCDGCGTCTRVCPHGALRLHIPRSRDFSRLRDPEEPLSYRNRGRASLDDLRFFGLDGNASVLIHDITACTHCGLCYLSCPREALEGWEDVCATETPLMRAFPVEVNICSQCRKPYKPQSEKDTRCASCSRFLRR